MGRLKYVLSMLVILLFVTSIVGCSSAKLPSTSENTSKEKSLNIVTTNKLLYYAVNDITGDKNNVTYLFKSFEDEWGYSISDDMVKKVNEADMLVYSGAGSEPWMEDFLDKVDRKKVDVINSSRGVKIINYTTSVKYKNETMKENPYYWLNPDDYRIMLMNVKNAIEDNDPRNRDFYEKNFDAAQKKIDNILESYKAVNKNLKNTTVVLDEDNLDYLFKYLDLNVIKIDRNHIIQSEIQDERARVEKKIAEAKNVVYIYSDENIIRGDRELIAKYNLQTVKLVGPTEDFQYIDTVNSNVDRLLKITEKK